MRRMRWHVSGKAGHDEHATEFEVTDADAEWLEHLRDQAERMPPSRKRSEILLSLRLTLDAFAVFQGARFVE